jgi:hypothetical protein
MPVLAAAWMALCAALKSIKVSAAALIYAALVLSGVVGAEVFEHAFRFRLLVFHIEGLGAQLADLKAKDAIALKTAQAKAAATTAAQIAATQAASLAEATAQARISTVYQTLSQEVATYVPPKADAACPIDVGAVRLLDAAARGLPAVSLAPAGADDAPSGVALSHLVSTDVANDEAAAANAEQLSALQAWIRAEQAAPAGVRTPLNPPADATAGR